MVALKEINEFTSDREANFGNAAKYLLRLTIHKFFDASNERVIDYELVDYVSNSKLRVEAFDRIAIIKIALDRLLCDDNFYFEELLEDNSFENMRDLTSFVIYWA